MQNYRHHIEEHLLPTFEQMAVLIGMRWGEVVGLEPGYVRPATIRVECQLYELDSGELLRCPPKDDSRHTIVVPEWLTSLVSSHVGRSAPRLCSRHRLAYAFRGYGAARGSSGTGAKLVDVARRAGVSTGTVSTCLNWPDSVADDTRARIELAIADLGYVRGAASGPLAAHWWRNNFAGRLFQPAPGRYPVRGRHPNMVVPILGDPWPGVPARGRGAAARANACWVPIAEGLTPHGLRHTYKTLMEELGTSHKFMDAQMGHEDGSCRPAAPTSRRPCASSSSLA